MPLGFVHVFPYRFTQWRVRSARSATGRGFLNSDLLPLARKSLFANSLLTRNTWPIRMAPHVHLYASSTVMIRLSRKTHCLNPASYASSYRRRPASGWPTGEAAILTRPLLRSGDGGESPSVVQ